MGEAGNEAEKGRRRDQKRETVKEKGERMKGHKLLQF